jgi:tripartite motif-containing protein 2/3
LLVLDFQVQIYNQYGQFVRKFGANILQHPRGVCVDNKGRIIVVECKVMRVIIFDQVTIRVPWLFDILLI